MILDREEAIRDNQDAEGKVYAPTFNAHTQLYEIKQMLDTGSMTKPKRHHHDLQSAYTNAKRCEEGLARYLNESWNLAELAQKKAARKKTRTKAE